MFIIYFKTNYHCVTDNNYMLYNYSQNYYLTSFLKINQRNPLNHHNFYTD